MKTEVTLNIFIIVLLASLNLTSNAALQNKDDDKEPKILSKKSDFEEVDRLIGNARKHLYSDPAKSQLFSLKALELSIASNYLKGKAYSNFYLSQIYLNFDFKNAETCLFESLSFAKDTDDKRLLNSIINSFGILYQSTGDYSNALKYFQQLLETYLTDGNDSLSAAVYNNLAMCYEILDNDSLALAYYLKAKELNKKYGSYSWLAINYQNLGSYFLKRQQTEKAKKYLFEALELENTMADGQLKAFIYYNLFEAAKKENDAKVAMKFAQLSLYEARKYNIINREKDALAAIVQLYEEQNRIDSAWFYQKALLAVRDSIRKISGLEKIRSLEMQNKLEEQQQYSETQISMLQVEKDQMEIKITILFVLAAVLLLVIGLVFWLHQIKQKHLKLEEAMSRMEKEMEGEELEFKKKEMVAHSIYMAQKNNLISHVTQKLKGLLPDVQGKNALEIKTIISELDSKTHNNPWEEFEIRFIEVHTDFYERLSKEYPNLTSGDLRLCGFLRLNMSNKEIAGITYQNVESIKTARYRLRKKLGLSREINLVHFLTKF
jgi:tetratricopeptide (TPR) repeat protein/DNA-binding CsgD family transcriptional regulator